MAQLIIRPRAADDIEAIRVWYEGERVGLGVQFLDELASRLEDIEREPLSFRRLAEDVRIAHLRRFPYHLYFGIHDDTIELLTVLHTARHPEAWRSHR